jgi:hypothetical protein
VDRRRFRRVLSLDHSVGADRQSAERAGKSTKRDRRSRPRDFRGRRLPQHDRLFQRFARGRLPVIGDISEHGYGVYFFHYPILLWLQYALLDQVMPAVAKGMLVLIGTVLASWGASVLTDRVLTACRPLFTRGVLLLGAELGANGRFSVSKLFD